MYSAEAPVRFEAIDKASCGVADIAICTSARRGPGGPECRTELCAATVSIQLLRIHSSQVRWQDARFRRENFGFKARI